MDFGIYSYYVQAEVNRSTEFADVALVMISLSQ